jgi:methylene-tetrahydromethanopterin dehydrogenase
MSAPYILHMLSPQKHMSPFDVNMALDAGFNAVLPYTNVTVDEVRGLTQDAMFSRSPSDCPRTGIFIGGKNAIEALDMLDKVREAIFPPFEVSVFADPAGSFTTAAAMVACVKKTLKQKFDRDLKGLKVAVFGATGVVGFCSAVIAAMEGADAVLAGYDGEARVRKSSEAIAARFNVATRPADGSNDAMKAALIADADVILCAGPAGRQVLSTANLSAARRLLVAADVNAVPPAGIEGVGVHDDAAPLAGTQAVGIGALAVGNVKYQTESGLFRQMIEAGDAGKTVAFDFRDAYRLAESLAG